MEEDVGTRGPQPDSEGSTPSLGRAGPPGPPSWFCDVLSEPGLNEIRRILLAGINPRCPTSGSITTLLGRQDCSI